MQTEEIERLKSLLVQWRDTTLALNSAWDKAKSEVDSYWPHTTAKDSRYENAMHVKCKAEITAATDAERELEEFYYQYVQEIRLLLLNALTSGDTLNVLPVTTSRTIFKVAGKYVDRERVGIKKYGGTVDETGVTETEWLVHLQHELMDATVYIEKKLDTHGDMERAILNVRKTAKVLARRLLWYWLREMSEIWHCCGWDSSTLNEAKDLEVANGLPPEIKEAVAICGWPNDKLEWEEDEQESNTDKA